MAARTHGLGSDPGEIADAIITANRALAEFSARVLDSLAPEVNLSEFRVLSILAQQGPQRLIDIAAALDVTSTTATRLADRLVEHGMVDRVRQSSDRREVHLAIAAAGRSLVRAVFSQRRRFVVSMLSDCTEREQTVALRVVNCFAELTTPSEMETA